MNPDDTPTKDQLRSCSSIFTEVETEGREREGVEGQVAAGTSALNVPVGASLVPTRPYPGFRLLLILEIWLSYSRGHASQDSMENPRFGVKFEVGKRKISTLERLQRDRPRIYKNNTSDSVGESLPWKPNILDIKLGAV